MGGMGIGQRDRAWVRWGGEFVVIVISVLVALALDQWVAARADRDSEREYLAALVADLEADADYLSELLIPLVSLADSALKEVGPVSRRVAEFPTDTIAFLRRVVSSRRTIAQLPFSPTFDELISTGALRLIESARLRSSLILYYDHMRAMWNRGQERSSGYAPIVRGHLPDDPESGRNLSEADLRAYGVRQAAEAVQTPEFAQALNRHVAYVQFFLSEVTLLQTELESLRLQAEAELDRFR
jgi:type II secretory pathway pseudopilin PulG